MMRRTVTLDDDVNAGIRSEMKRTGDSFKRVVNRLLRLGFGVPEPPVEDDSKSRPVGRRKNKSR